MPRKATNPPSLSRRPATDDSAEPDLLELAEEFEMQEEARGVVASRFEGRKSLSSDDLLYS